MIIWSRLGAVLLVTLLVLGCLEYLGVSRILGRSPAEVQEATYGRNRELFWFLIFTIVMATSLLAAVRRWMGHLSRAVTPARRP